MMLSPRPLMPLEAVQSLMDLGEDEVVELIDEGLILPVFNIACRTARRRELRVLSAGVEYFASMQMPLPVDTDAVCENLVPLDAPLTTATLRRTLNCSGTLITHLISESAFSLAAGSTVRRGPGGEGKVDRVSMVQFLKKRLVI